MYNISACECLLFRRNCRRPRRDRIRGRRGMRMAAVLVNTVWVSIL